MGGARMEHLSPRGGEGKAAQSRRCLNCWVLEDV